MIFHKNTYMSLEEIGTRIPEYQPTFDFQGEFIDASHRYFSDCPLKEGLLIEVRNPLWFNSVIKGFLQRADALKLYELAYFVQGDILELGSFQGLSTSILSRANQNAPHQKRIVSVELRPLQVFQTHFNLFTMGLHKDVTVICDDAASAMRKLAHENRKFEFIFIDHSHTFEHTQAACRELSSILKKGGFCLFHDFNDNRNRDINDLDYGVYQAVHENLDPKEFEFCGIYGCSALYRAI